MIKEIKFPFQPRFRQDVAMSQKIMSTRPKKLGKAGDYFWVNDGSEVETKCVLLATFKLRLWQVAGFLSDAEGFRNQDEFIKTWNDIYPQYNYEQCKQNNFWVHVFTPANQWLGYDPDIRRAPTIEQIKTTGEKQQ